MRKKRSAGVGEAKPLSRFHWRFSIWNLVFLLVGAAVSVSCIYLWRPDDDASATAESVAKSRVSPARVNPKHPWGNIDTVQIMLDRPEDYLGGDQAGPSQISWFFGSNDPGRARSFLRQCGLPENQARSLDDTNHWRMTSAGLWLIPPLDLVRDMEPVTRGRIYRFLAKYAENESQRYPCFVKKRSFKEWFADSGLAPDKLALIERMTYRHKDALYFADLPLLQMTFSRDDLRRAVRTISRVPSLLMRLEVTPDTDVDALLRYWGTSTRTAKIKPLLQSLKQVQDGTIINVSWFFPPVPRLLVYSYPNPTNSIGGRFPDCFWTAMNFFNETADPRMLGSQYSLQVLQTQYENVPKPELFGDVIMLYEREGNIINPMHVCVFVAQDVVFTKNGHSLRQPWVLMRLSDMMSTYVSEKPLLMTTYRSKSR